MSAIDCLHALETPATIRKLLFEKQELNLEGNELTTAGLRGLMGLRRLVKLDLGYNQISDLHPLCGLTGLSQLSLESNLLHK